MSLTVCIHELLSYGNTVVKRNVTQRRNNQRMSGKSKAWCYTIHLKLSPFSKSVEVRYGIERFIACSFMLSTATAYIRWFHCFMEKGLL